jgi:hypothetical protein
MIIIGLPTYYYKIATEQMNYWLHQQTDETQNTMPCLDTQVGVQILHSKHHVTL